MKEQPQNFNVPSFSLSLSLSIDRYHEEERKEEGEEEKRSEKIDGNYPRINRVRCGIIHAGVPILINTKRQAAKIMRGKSALASENPVKQEGRLCTG